MARIECKFRKKHKWLIFWPTAVINACFFCQFERFRSWYRIIWSSWSQNKFTELKVANPSQQDHKLDDLDIKSGGHRPTNGSVLTTCLVLQWPIVCLHYPTPRAWPRPRPRMRELGSLIMCGNVFTAPTLTAMQISIGFCTKFIGIGLGLGVRQYKWTIRATVTSIVGERKAV